MAQSPLVHRVSRSFLINRYLNISCIELVRLETCFFLLLRFPIRFARTCYHIYKIPWRFCIAANPPFPKIDHKHLIASVTLAYEAEVPQIRISHEL